MMANPYVVFFSVLGVAMSGAAWHRKASEWVLVFLPASRRLLRGEDFYLPKDLFVYPPFTALVGLPFALLGDRLGSCAWYVVNYACLVAIIGIAWRLSGGHRRPSIRREDAIPVAEHVVFFIGCAVAIRYLLNAISHTQTDLVIGAALMAGCLAATRRQFARAAVWWGLGAAFKGPPLLFAAYLAWRRRWLAAAGVVAVFVGVNLLPNLVSHSPTGGLWLTRWTAHYAKPMGKDGVPGAWYNTPVNNQSLSGAVNRWLTSTPGLGPNGAIMRPRAGAPGPAALRTTTLLVDAAFAAITAWAMWRGRRSRAGGAAAAVAGDDARTTVLECATVLCLMLLLSPMSSRSHFGVLILPAFLLARAAVYDRDRTAAAFLVVPLATTLLAVNIGINRGVEDVGLWFGTVMLSTISLMLGCVHLLVHPSNVGAPLNGGGDTRENADPAAVPASGDLSQA
jgi:hypothetical protein